jgi:alkylated DNA repair protein alkB family protein 4
MGTAVKIKPCDCKGKRTCLLCENLLDKTPRKLVDDIKVSFFFACYDIGNLIYLFVRSLFQALNTFVYCMTCQKIFKGWDLFESCKEHESLVGKSFSGVLIEPNFLTKADADQLVSSVDDLGWDKSQSGRRKKNFGPKVNFKKKKLSLGKFDGFLQQTNAVREKLKAVPLLSDFVTIEECFLEYDKIRGSQIEPHIDDCWIW